MELEELRTLIDGLDTQITDLLLKRFELTSEIGRLKKATHAPVARPQRETEILERLCSGLNAEQAAAVKSVYSAIFAASKSAQSGGFCGKLGLLGAKLAHSLSPQIYEGLGYFGYDLVEIADENALADFVKARKCVGYNVTIPYKKAVMPLLDFVSEEASAIGAVNTVIDKDGKLCGFNTDIDGMRNALRLAGIEVEGKTVLVLGSGGTAKTAEYLCKTGGASCVYEVSRRGKINYENCYEVDANVVINATPVGMYPNSGATPIDLTRFPHLEGVFDAVYNPLETRLISKARALGVKAANGLTMLSEQARLSYAIFTGQSPKNVTGFLEKLKESLVNVVIVGMPGSGKSTIGRAVAELTHKEFCDTDDIVREQTKKTAAEIIAQSGEAEFRIAERKAIKSAASRFSAVIATGGGAVLCSENRDNLKTNGIIVYLKRDINELATDGRPLSADGNIVKLYAERTPIYEGFADITVGNVGTPQSVAVEIVKAVKETLARKPL